MIGVKRSERDTKRFAYDVEFATPRGRCILSAERSVGYQGSNRLTVECCESVTYGRDSVGSLLTHPLTRAEVEALRDLLSTALEDWTE